MSGAEVALLAVPAASLLVSATLEVAFRSTSRLDLRRWAARVFARDDAEASFTDDLEVAFIAVRLARQLSLLSLAVVFTWLSRGWTATWELVLVLVLALALYVVIDKLLAVGLVAVVGPLRVLSRGRFLVVLLRKVLGGLAGRLYRFQRGSRARQESHPHSSTEGELDALLDLAEEEGLVGGKHEALLRGVADFGEAVVDEVMTPRVDIVSIDGSATLSDLRRLVAERKFSRIPVVREGIDRVVGIVHIKDLVTALEEGKASAPVTEVARPALFVPETKRVRDLLGEFQRQRAHMAIVVDEYGGTAGLVTLEDVLEEIVGEIQDEYEDEEALVTEDDGTVIAPGKAEVEEIERLLEIEVPDDEFETVGGMAFAHFGYVPRAGESFDYGGLRVEVLEADERRVQRVRITRTGARE